MANTHQGSVEIQLDQPRTLKYDFQAIAEIESVLGMTIIEVVGSLPIGMRDLASVLRAGLLHEDPELAKGDRWAVECRFGQYIAEPGRYFEIGELVASALQAVLTPPSKNEPGPKATRKKSGIGNES